MTGFLLITALTVSIDSFFCGFALSLKSGKKITVVLGIFLTVLIMCFATNYAAILLSKVITEKTASIGGIILICVGIYNLVKKDEHNNSQTHTALHQSLISGFAVGLDGAVANLSLSLMGINAFYVPITIALMHAITISLGIALANAKFVKKFSRFNFLPSVVLIALGIYKTLGFFI